MKPGLVVYDNLQPVNSKAYSYSSLALHKHRPNYVAYHKGPLEIRGTSFYESDDLCVTQPTMSKTLKISTVLIKLLQKKQN